MVIAVQEPGISKASATTYCPRGYTLSYEAKPETRVAFMVSKELGVEQWSSKRYGPYVAALQLQLQGTLVTIINCYRPTDTVETTQMAEDNMRTALQERVGETILLGDFNAHHPRWGLTGRCDPAAERLIEQSEEAELVLLTPAGIPTYKKGQIKSVIDLTFATKEIERMRVRCGPVDDWALTRDHIPILLELRATVGSKEERKRYAISKLDRAQLIQDLQASHWAEEEEPLLALHKNLRKAMKEHCPRTRTAAVRRPEWTERISQLTKLVRQARRRSNVSDSQADLVSYKTLKNELQRELRKESRNSWRRFVESLDTEGTGNENNRLLWRMAKWSKLKAGKPQPDIHMPSLMGPNSVEPAEKPEDKIAILAEKFFPGPPQADLSDIADGTHATVLEPVAIEQNVSVEEVLEVLRRLATNKAPGPDLIPNEILTNIRTEIAPGLAQAISRCFASGEIPTSLKESITVVLRKADKKDFTIPNSYRPIALENALAKVVEKLIANRLTLAAETHALLPWSQMGARTKRSTLTAIELLTDCVETAWKGQPGCVVTVLSLDIAGAYDNVSHERLLHILKRKGIPTWLVQVVASFLTARHTRIAIPGYTGDRMETQTGIPQGSPLSPILFLYYGSELLEDLQRGPSDTLAWGFVDDTNLATWGPTATGNCRRLERLHQTCEQWARRHGACFAPDKYKLMHLTRGHKHKDLEETVQIGGHKAELQKEEMKVLGVWIDPKLSWKHQIQRASAKAGTTLAAIRRIAASTWGVGCVNTRRLYSAITRPTLTYGAQIWGQPANGKLLQSSKLNAGCKRQNEGLRLILGAYARTPVAAMERELNIPPLDQHVHLKAMQYAVRTQADPVRTATRSALDKVWRSSRSKSTLPKNHPRPRTKGEELLIQAANAIRTERSAKQAERKAKAWRKKRQPRQVRDLPDKVLLRHAFQRRWKRQWRRTAERRLETVWRHAWDQQPISLYQGLTKPEATALFLMRSETLGLNAWLSKIGVPDKTPGCECGWHAQTVEHVLIHCPRHDRTELFIEGGPRGLPAMLTQPDSARQAAKWFLRSGALPHLRVAKELAETTAPQRDPLPSVETWRTGGRRTASGSQVERESPQASTYTDSLRQLALSSNGQ